jgi:hypothetical protein
VSRSIYRCDELLDYNGSITDTYANQGLFIRMDAILMVGQAPDACCWSPAHVYNQFLVLLAYAIVHPGRVGGRPLF